MSSFEMFSMKRKEEQIPVKFPIRKLEMAIQKFIKVLEIDLERLEKHRINIEKKAAELKSLNIEQINASRTVQSITQNIKELEQTRNQVLDTDLDEFDSKVISMKTRAITDLIEFRNIYGDQEVQALKASQTDNEETAAFVSDSICDNLEEENHTAASQLENAGDITENGLALLSMENGGDFTQIQIQDQLRLDAEQCAQVEQSWNELEHNLMELNSLMTDFSAIVHSQSQTVDQIEDHVETAQQNVEEGTSYLAQAAKYKTTLMPVAGAIVGGAVGGPLGLVAGLKVGSIAALGGGIVGFTGGKYLKKKHQNQVDEDMIDIKQRREERQKTQGEGTCQKTVEEEKCQKIVEEEMRPKTLGEETCLKTSNVGTSMGYMQ